MSDLPIVSLLVPCYNHAKFLDDCLGSIASQTYKNIELIICDDCSKDDSFTVINSHKEELESQISHVLIMRNETNQGVTKNLNRMIKLAKGDFIKIIASDDALAENAIEEFVSYAGENPSADVIFCNGKVIPEDVRIFEKGAIEQCGKIYDKAPDLAAQRLAENIFYSNELSAPCAFYRRSVFERYGLYDETFSIEDLEFWLRLLEKGGCGFAFLDEPLVYYRRNAESITSSSVNERTEQRLIRFHTAELTILEKYRSLVSPKVFADAMLKRYFNIFCFARANGLKRLEDMVEMRYKSFDCWKEVPLSRKAFFAAQKLKAKLRYRN